MRATPDGYPRTHGLAIIRFRSPLLTEYPLLQVLRCFTSLRTPRAKTRCQPMTAGGLPHSDTLGSKPCRRLPQDYRGPTRPSSVLSAKASTIRPSRQPQQIIMTKALLKNPRTTSDHRDTPQRCAPTRYERTQENNLSDSNHSTNTNPTHHGAGRCSRPLSSSQTTTPPGHPPRTNRHQASHPGDNQATTPPHTGAGGGQGTQQHAPHHKPIMTLPRQQGTGSGANHHINEPAPNTTAHRPCS